jgi:ribosomal protein S18 acetylase RimI-like enzyme
MELAIRLAKKREIDRAFSLLKGAAVWLKDKNINHWQNWLNPLEREIDWVRQGFESNQFYFALFENKVVGMFRLLWNDEMFWGIRENNAGYVHSLTIDRNYHGKGIGWQVIAIIEDLCRQNIKEYLRLDCADNNVGLCLYYEQCGFTAVGITELNNEKLRLYEKPLFESSY